jgi:hypothetical protein
MRWHTRLARRCHGVEIKDALVLVTEPIVMELLKLAANVGDAALVKQTTLLSSARCSLGMTGSWCSALAARGARPERRRDERCAHRHRDGDRLQVHRARPAARIGRFSDYDHIKKCKIERR